MKHAWIFAAILAMAIGLSWMGFVPTFIGALIAMSVAAIALFYLPAGIFQKIGYVVGTILLTIFVLLPVMGASAIYLASDSEMIREAMKTRQAAWYLWIATQWRSSGTSAEAKKQYACSKVEEARTKEVATAYGTAVKALESAPWSIEAKNALEEVHRRKALIAVERDQCKKEKKLTAGYVPTPSGGGTSGGTPTTTRVPVTRVVVVESSILDDISPEMVGIMVLASIGLILIARKASGFGILVGLILGVSLGLMLILQYYPRYGVTQEVLTSAIVATAILAVAGWFGGARSLAVTLIFAFVISLIPAGMHAVEWSKKHDPNSPWVLHADGRRY